MYCEIFQQGCLGYSVAGGCEVFSFARPLRKTFELELTRLPYVENFLSDKSGDYRVFNHFSHNYGMSIGAYDISGYSAMVLRRYSELIHYAAGENPKAADMYLTFSGQSRISSLYRMLRCRFMLLPPVKISTHPASTSQPLVDIVIATIDRPLGRLQLIGDYRVLKDRDAIFEAMAAPSFDPCKTVILESKPSYKTSGNAPIGSVRIVDESTDHLTIEANLETPAILLVTDAYHSSWRAESLPGSSQRKYEVIPANYAFRAISLAAGQHRFKMEYKPLAFVAGMWISIISWAVYLVYLVYLGYCGFFRYKTTKI